MRSDCKSKTPTLTIGNVQKAAERSIYRLMGVTVELFRLVNSPTMYNSNYIILSTIHLACVCLYMENGLHDIILCVMY